MKNGVWAILDQGLFASSNFAMNILLARWLVPQEYGAFGLAFALFTFVGAMHTATLTEPMLIFSPGKYKDDISGYLGALLYGHLIFAVSGSLVLLAGGVVCLFWGPEDLFPVLFALALTGPLILLLWLLRRACYARFEPHLAAWGGAWYMILMLGGAYALYRSELLSTSTALGVMGLSSLLISLWLARRLHVELPPLRKGTLARDSLRSHWEYGRWSVANRALYWLPTNMYYLILPMLGGLAVGASFKALMNLLMPMIQVTAALSVLLLPTLVRARQEGKFTSSVRFALCTLLLAPVFYWIFLGLFDDYVVHLAYGGRYAGQADLLWILGVLPIAMAANEALSQAMRALERPDALFKVYAIYTVVGCTFGVWCMYEWLVAGAGIGILVSRIILAVMMAVMLVFMHGHINAGKPLAQEDQGQR